MNEEIIKKFRWGTWLIVVVSIMFGFVIGLFVGLPNTMTFGLTPELHKEIEQTRNEITRVSELSLNVSKEECPTRLNECRQICRELK